MKFTSCCEISQRTSFVSMMTLTSTFFFVELVVGYLTNSMALVADSFHMLSDVVSLFVGYIALRYSKRSSEGGNGRYTFGWARAEVLGALVNAVFLIALCFSILVESFKRIVVPEAIEDPKLVLLVGGIGLFVNIIGLMLFHNHGHSHGGGGHGHSHGGSGDHGHSHEGKNSKKNGLTHEETGKTEKSQLMIEGGLEVSIVDNKQQNVEENQLADENTAEASQLNMRGVYLHVLGDALGSVIVMVSALVILYVDAEWTLYVDPGMSIIMVMIILKTSFPLLKESSMILMQTVPTHIKLQEIQQRIQEQVPQVLGIHEFHVWQLAGNRIVASAHVRCNTPADYMQVANQLKELFHDEGIHSTTIQPEFLKEIPIEDEECVLECKEECNDRLCCSKPTDSIDKPNDSIDGNDCVETSSTKDEKSLKPKKEVRINIE